MIAAQPNATVSGSSQTCRGMLLNLPRGAGTRRSEIRLGAVVVTVTVADAELDPLRVTDGGDGEHAASNGAPLQAKLTTPLRPPPGAMLKLYVAVPPADTVALREEPTAGEMEKSVPVPERATLCGLPGTLSVMVSVPFRGPATVGKNVIWMEQLAAGAIVFAHWLV